MKAVNLLVNSQLPKDLRRKDIRMTADGLEEILVEAARRYPDDFKDITQRLANVGRMTSWTRGTSLRLNDFKPVFDVRDTIGKMEREIQQARFAADDDEEFQREREKIWLKYQGIIEKTTMTEGARQGNSLVNSVASGARGKPSQVTAMLSTPGVYQDSRGNIVPLFVRNSFSQGLRPAELLATTYGTRSAVITGKRATAKGGDFAKQLKQTSADLVVTTKDCGTTNGIDLAPDDPSLRGRVTTSGAVVDRRLQADLKTSGLKKIIVRSPLTCEAERGICAKCLGLQADGRFAGIGFMAGQNAADALSEPVAQGALRSKHCLVEGTLVRMADFSLKPIETIAPGDMVLGADISGNTFPVVVKALHNQGTQDVSRYVYRMGNGDTHLSVTCTEDHQILGKVAGRQAKIPAGETVDVVLADGQDATRTKVEPGGHRQCWDITVDHPDELFVLHNGLIVKNTAGMASSKKDFSGFDVINRFVQAPENFQDATVLSREGGMVEAVREAPQGGKLVIVEGREHYVPPGVEVTVKPGQQVDAGDELSEGLTNPAEVVELRGLGEGRRYYAERLKRIMDDSGMKADPINTEVVARAALRHVRIDEATEDDDWLPDDLVDYNRLRTSWKPQAEEQAVDAAPGKYLAVPVLHHTLGTRITPRMAQQIADAGISKVSVTDQKPPFTPEMPRLRTASHGQEDWLAGQSTSYLKSQLLEGAERGADTNVLTNTHYAPRLAVGENFGTEVERTGMF